MRCFHVTTDQGAVFSVAATGKRDALQMVQDRITRERDEATAVGVEPRTDRPAKAEDVGTWHGVDYGTVLCVTGPKED